MSGVTISTLNIAQEVKETLIKEMNFLSREGIHVKFEEAQTDKFYFLDCSIIEEDSDIQKAHEKILKYYLANIITDLLMDSITKEFILRIIKCKYRFLTPAELKVIMQNSYSYINNLHEEGDIGKTLARHNQILTDVNEYLHTNSMFFLEGFFRFRLKDYFADLEKSVDLSMDNFLVEQEYHEFIRLLRYFVDVQEPRIDEVHVLIKDKHNFYLLDEDRKPIDQEQLQGVLAEFNKDIEYDDLLLSALITISPRKLILHLADRTEIVETILNVFQERVTLCKGCPICSEQPKITRPKFESLNLNN